METGEEIMLMVVCTTTILKFHIFLSDREQMYALLEKFKNIHVRFGEVEELQRFEKCHDMYAKQGRIYIISTMIVATLYVLNDVSACVTCSLQSGERFVTPMNVTVDTLFSKLSKIQALHFDIVAKRFAKFDFSASVRTTAERKLIRLIVFHDELLDLAGKTKKKILSSSGSYITMLLSLESDV